MELKVDFTISQKTKNNWQRMTNLLADMMKVEAGFITQITGDKAKILMTGSDEEIEIVEGDVIDLAEIYCHEPVEKQEMVEINDARKIEKWQDSIELDLGFISYLGVPIFYPQNQEVFGTICVVDSGPRSFSQKEKNLLKEFKLSIENQLENIMLNNRLGRQVEFIQSSLDSLSANIAVIDEEGTIIYTNGAGDKFFKENDLAPEQSGEGSNYLQIIEQAKIAGAEKAEDALQGIKSVISGEKEAFSLEYPCHSPQGERWFKMRVTPFQGEAPFAAVVAHENITERKEILNDLQRNQRFLESSQDIANLGTWELNLERNELAWSDEVYQIFGLEPQEFEATYEAFLEAVHPDDREAVDEAYSTSVEQGKTGYEIEHRIVRRDNGEVRFVWEKCVHTKDDEGNIIRSLGIVQDITERKKAEKELKMTKFSLDNADMMIFRITPEGEILYANEHVSNKIGYSSEKIQNMNMAEFVVDEDFIEYEKFWQQIKQNNSLSYERRFITSEGEVFPASVVSQYFQYEDEEYEFVFARDITEGKEMEEELRIREEQYRKIFETAPVGIMLEDSEGTILEINDSLCEMTGFSEEELVGSSALEKLTPPEFKEKARKNIERIIAGETLEFTGSSRRKNGERYYVRLNETKVNLPEGEEGILSIQMDMTELKEKEKIIENLHEVALDFKGLTDEKEVCEYTVEAAENLLQFELCNIALVEDEVLIPQAKTAEVKHNKMVITEGIAGRTYREGESFLIDNIENNLEAKPVKSSYKSAISVPVGEYGVFQAATTSREGFSEEDLELAEILLSHTIAALERIYSQKELKYKTFHDSLTDLYNRSYLEEEMQRLDTERQLPISLIMVDVNGMKIVNDTYGHEKGDELLIKVADILRENTRDEDIVSRWAGDEFVILLPQTEAEKAEEIGRRIKKACEGAEFGDIPITLGIGIAAKRNIEERFEDVLKRADKRMYKDKLTQTNSAENRLVMNMLNTLAAKSAETKEHAMRMTELAHRIGDEVGMSAEQLKRLSLLATLHDIGKITISEDILTKPEKLSDKEWQIFKEHPERGHKIIKAADDFAHIAKEVLHHHEKWDGTGYPKGLEGKEIPLLSRIIAIVDAYDVMTTGRPYRELMSKEEALEEIEDCAGSQFDPELAKQFVKMMQD